MDRKESYAPNGETKNFDFGFLKAATRPSKLTTLLKYIPHRLHPKISDTKCSIKIPYVSIRSKYAVQYLQSAEGKKAFSIIHRVWQLANHDNTIHNRFFLQNNPMLNLWWARKYQFPYIMNDHPSSVFDDTFGNIYEVRAIHAHRDLIYTLYQKSPQLKNHVLDLGVEMMDVLIKIKDHNVRKSILNLFAYPYGRIIDIFSTEFRDPYQSLSYHRYANIDNLKPYHRNLPILFENIKYSDIYKEQSVLRKRIHNPDHYKLFDPFSDKKYKTHAEVIQWLESHIVG